MKKMKKNEKIKKNNINKFILFFIFSIILIFVFLFNNIKHIFNIKNSNVFLILEILEEKKTEYVLILTDSKNIFSKKENKNINNIIKKILKMKKIDILSLDYYKNKKEIIFFIKKYNIIKLPVIIIVNKKNSIEKIFFSPFEINEITNTINKNFMDV